MTAGQLTTEQQIIAACIEAFVGLWVANDALLRGREPGESYLWGLGVFMLWIVFLPVYLWMRRKWTRTAPSGAAKTQTQCRYCGAFNDGDPDYCTYCSRQLKSAEIIHRK